MHDYGRFGWVSFIIHHEDINYICIKPSLVNLAGQIIVVPVYFPGFSASDSSLVCGRGV